jgi:hypothetical protein
MNILVEGFLLYSSVLASLIVFDRMLAARQIKSRLGQLVEHQMIDSMRVRRGQLSRPYSVTHWRIS